MLCVFVIFIYAFKMPLKKFESVLLRCYTVLICEQNNSFRTEF